MNINIVDNFVDIVDIFKSIRIRQKYSPLGCFLARDSLSSSKSTVQHRFFGLLPFCQCRRAYRQKGSYGLLREGSPEPSRFVVATASAHQTKSYA